MTLVASVQHTGTWFILEFLRPFHKQIVEWRHVGSDTQVGPNDLLQVHVGMYLADDFEEHNEPKSVKFIKALMLASKSHPLVIPLRDPMLAMRTRERRHPWIHHGHIPEGMAALGVAYPWLKHHAHFFPVDLPQKEGLPKRIIRLERLYEYALKKPAEGHEARKAIKAFSDWHKVNSTERTEVGYSMSELRERHPKEMAMFGKWKPQIQFMLEDMGYRKLPWF